MRILPPGGNIAIVSPSGALSATVVADAVAAIRSLGYNVEVMPHVLGCATSVFAASDEQRADDLQEAITRHDIDAIICARGGYGAVRTIQRISPTVFANCDKWIVGFSDITAIHSLLSHSGVPSVHGPMLKFMSECGVRHTDVIRLFDILGGKAIEPVTFAAEEQNRCGTAEGTLTGGNLSIIYSLRATPADIVADGNILFIEDLSEYHYHLDRMMQNLRYSGVLEKLSGLVVGRFTGMKDGATPYGSDAYGIIADAVSDYGYPVAFGYPAGHGDGPHTPLVMGSKVRLSVSAASTKMEWI